MQDTPYHVQYDVLRNHPFELYHPDSAVASLIARNATHDEGSSTGLHPALRPLAGGYGGGGGGGGGDGLGGGGRFGGGGGGRDGGLGGDGEEGGGCAIVVMILASKVDNEGAGGFENGRGGKGDGRAGNGGLGGSR